jgi:hypothetical protein
MTFKSGKYARATTGVGNTELPILQFGVTPSVDHAEFRNSKTGNFTVVDPTFFPPCQVEIVLDWDLDANPFATPPNLTAGATISNTNLYPNGGTAGSPTGDHWIFSSLLVKGTPQECVVDGKIGTRIQCISSGAWQYLAGSTRRRTCRKASRGLLSLESLNASHDQIEHRRAFEAHA